MGDKGDFDEVADRSAEATEGGFGFTDSAKVERRVWRNIFAVIAAALVVSAIFASAKFTFSLALGSALALLNFKWLHASLRGILGLGLEHTPPGTTMKFIFRWLVIGAVIYGAMRTNYFEVIGMMTGLFAPALAILIEAVYMTYKTLDQDNREK